MSTAIAGCGGGGAGLRPATPAAKREAPPAADAVWVELQPEKPEQRWSLLGKDDKVVCALPCARWLSPDGGDYLTYEKPGTTVLVSVGLPRELGPPGGDVVAVARADRRAKGLSRGLILGGVSVGLLGLILAFALDDRGPEATTAALASGLGAGTLMAAVGLYVGAVTHSPDVVLRGGSGSPPVTVSLGHGLAETPEAPSSGLHVLLTPFGASGTF
jgi:hypothetical protein